MIVEKHQELLNDSFSNGEIVTENDVNFDVLAKTAT